MLQDKLHMEGLGPLNIVPGTSIDSGKHPCLPFQEGRREGANKMRKENTYHVGKKHISSLFWGKWSYILSYPPNSHCLIPFATNLKQNQTSHAVPVLDNPSKLSPLPLLTLTLPFSKFHDAHLVFISSFSKTQMSWPKGCCQDCNFAHSAAMSLLRFLWCSSDHGPSLKRTTHFCQSDHKAGKLQYWCFRWTFLGFLLIPMLNGDVGRGVAQAAYLRGCSINSPDSTAYSRILLCCGRQGSLYRTDSDDRPPNTPHDCSHLSICWYARNSPLSFCLTLLIFPIPLLDGKKMDGKRPPWWNQHLKPCFQTYTGLLI